MNGACEWCKQVDLISYKQKLNQAAQNLGATSFEEISDPILQHEARVEAASLHRPVHAQNRLAQQNELKNQAVYDTGADFKMIDRKMVFNNGNVRVTDFDEGAKLAGTYQESDATTNRSLEASFNEGASLAVTSFWRKGNDHRDIFVYTYDKEANTGKTICINAAVDGNLHTFERIAELAQKEFPELKAFTPTTDVFVLNNAAKDLSVHIKPALAEPLPQIPAPKLQIEPTRKPDRPRPEIAAPIPAPKIVDNIQIPIVRIVPQHESSPTLSEKRTAISSKTPETSNFGLEAPIETSKFDTRPTPPERKVRAPRKAVTTQRETANIMLLPFRRSEPRAIFGKTEGLIPKQQEAAKIVLKTRDRITRPAKLEKRHINTSVEQTLMRRKSKEIRKKLVSTEKHQQQVKILKMETKVRPLTSPDPKILLGQAERPFRRTKARLSLTEYPRSAVKKYLIIRPERLPSASPHSGLSAFADKKLPKTSIRTEKTIRFKKRLERVLLQSKSKLHLPKSEQTKFSRKKENLNERSKKGEFKIEAKKLVIKREAKKFKAGKIERQESRKRLNRLIHGTAWKIPQPIHKTEKKTKQPKLKLISGWHARQNELVQKNLEKNIRRLKKTIRKRQTIRPTQIFIHNTDL